MKLTPYEWSHETNPLFDRWQYLGDDNKLAQITKCNNDIDVDPTIYCQYIVAVDGKRIDSFLSLERAQEVASNNVAPPYIF